ncbi:hypothetical protein JXA85_08535 [Candidatus Woesearchaeota archaeon]|nr:hypothetical protein [Candidatus Woesearchaeota archaeon]
MVDIFLIKLMVSVALVVLLSIITEHISPRISGMISGLPTGTAIILFFIGLEQGAGFAKSTSVYNLAGITSMQIFLYGYYFASKRANRFRIIISAFGALIPFSVALILLKQIHFNVFTALIPSIGTLILFSYLYKKTPDSRIKKPIKFSLTVLLARAIVASSIILLITELARLVGPEWTGLFSSIPTTVFPLLIIIHHSYGKDHIHTIIKNLTGTLPTLALYCLAVFFAYPLLGVYWGTAIAYGTTAIYLMVFFFVFRN